MALYVYGPKAAINPDTGSLLESGQGQVYTPSDTSFTAPLSVVDLNGLPMPRINVYDGLTEQFRVEGQPVVVWRDSSGIAVSLDADGGNVPPGGTDGQVLVKQGSDDYACEWVDAADAGVSTMSTFSTFSVMSEPTDPYADLPAGTSIVVSKTGTTWPPRPTQREDIIVFWRGAEPSPTGMYPGDVRLPPSL